MSLFHKYKLAGKTYHDSQYTLYRGFDSLENSVLIKTIHSRLLKLVGTDWLKNEYHILTGVNIAGIIQPHSLENYQKNFALVLEDFPGLDFTAFLTNQSLTLDLFFEIALQLVIF